MERQGLFLSAPIVLALWLLLPLVAARPGGRLCHTSFFFPDPNNVRTITLLGDSNNGVPAHFKLFSISASGFLRSPSNLVQVRFLHLQRLMFPNPAFPHSLDLPLAGILADKPFIGEPDHNEIVQTWSFSTSNPHHPATWIDVRSRRALSRPDHSIPHVEQKSMPWYEYVMLCSFFALAFASIFMPIWGFILSYFTSSNEDHNNVGFLCGYQELPSPGASEKEVAQKEFAKKAAAEAENA